MTTRWGHEPDRVLLLSDGDMKEEELPLFGVLTSVMCMMDTEKYTYQELSQEVNIYTGGIAIIRNAMHIRIRDRT